MKMNNNIPDGLKTFCYTIWIFMCAVIGLLALSLLCWEFSFSWLYDFVVMLLGIAVYLGIVLPFVWILITIIWCVVIAKKENNKKIFFHPAVVITNVISIIYALFIFGTM